jgi:hypothetical protein
VTSELTTQQLDEIDAKAAYLRERLDRKNPWPSDNESFWTAEGWKNGTRNALDKLHVPALVAEVRRQGALIAAVMAVHEKGEHNGLPICLHCASQMFPPPETGIWSESAYPCATLQALRVTEDQAATSPAV